MHSTFPLTKREEARAILDDLFRDRRRIPIAEAVNAGRDRGISKRTICRASVEMGVREIHNGPLPAFWELPG